MSAGHSSYEPKTGIEKWLDARLPLPRLMYDSFVSYPVPRNLNYAYAFGGILSIMLSGFIRNPTFEVGNPYLLAPIAAAVLGGTAINGGIGSMIGAVGHHVLWPGGIALKEGDGLPEVAAPGSRPHAGAAVAFLGIIQALAHRSPTSHALLAGPLEIDAVALEDVEQRVLKTPRIIAHAMRVNAPPATHLMDGFRQLAGRPAEPRSRRNPGCRAGPGWPASSGWRRTGGRPGSRAA